MSEERRFDEKEIAEIFERAIKEQELANDKKSVNGGLSLQELQKIGAESGIEPEFIARAVHALTHEYETITPLQYLGVPISAGRTAKLPRALTDTEWEQLVVDCRTTFKARGKIEVSGTLRQWSNGNLHVFVEPIGSGYQLRMETTKGNAKGGLGIGVFNLVAGLLVLLASFLLAPANAGTPITTVAALLILIGASYYGGFAFTLPGWARERERQMEAISSRVVERLAQPPSETITSPEKIPIISYDDGVDEEGDKDVQRSRKRLRS